MLVKMRHDQNAMSFPTQILSASMTQNIYYKDE